MRRKILWVAAALAALVWWRRGRRLVRAEERASAVADRWVPLIYGITTGLVEAWRTAQAGHHRTARLGPLLPAHGWRGGAAGSAALAPPGVRPAPLRPPSSLEAPPGIGAPDCAPSEAVAAAHRATDELSALVRWWQYLKLLFQRFGKDQCPVFAAALSFFGLLSIVPVLLVAIAALGYIIFDPTQPREQLVIQARDHVLRFVQELLPGNAARVAAKQLLEQIHFENQVSTLMEKRGLAGILGVATLIWAALQIFVSSVPAMNAAWEVPETRSWLRLRLVALGLLVGAGALFLLSLLPSSGPDLVRRLHIPWLGLPEHVPWPIELLFALLAVAINAVMFTLIYRFLPAAPVTWRQAVVGGATMGLLWELAKQGFSLYLATMGERNAMYGALGGVVILVTWIYYTSMLLLLGAEVAKLYKDVRERKSQRGGQKAVLGC